LVSIYQKHKQKANLPFIVALGSCHAVPVKTKRHEESLSLKEMKGTCVKKLPKVNWK
jgi:hypothetical protein